MKVPRPMFGPTPRQRPLRIPSSRPIRYRRTNVLGSLYNLRYVKVVSLLNWSCYKLGTDILVGIRAMIPKQGHRVRLQVQGELNNERTDSNPLNLTFAPSRFAV